MADSLFTFVCEFRGYTCVSQVEAADERDALKKWASKFADEKPIPRVSGVLARNAVKWLEYYDMPPNATKGVENVWYTTSTSGRDMMGIDIVRTERGSTAS